MRELNHLRLVAATHCACLLLLFELHLVVGVGVVVVVYGKDLVVLLLLLLLLSVVSFQDQWQRMCEYIKREKNLLNSQNRHSLSHLLFAAAPFMRVGVENC